MLGRDGEKKRSEEGESRIAPPVPGSSRRVQVGCRTEREVRRPANFTNAIYATMQHSLLSIGYMHGRDGAYTGLHSRRLAVGKTLQACLANSFSSHHRAPLQRKQAWFQVRIQRATFLRGVMGQSRTQMQTPLTARPCSGPGLSRRLQAATEKRCRPVS